MSKMIPVPVKTIGTENWGRLNHFGRSHIIVAEDFDLKDANFSFAGQHRVRRYKVKGNVHWQIPTGGKLYNISAVEGGKAQRRTVR